MRMHALQCSLLFFVTWLLQVNGNFVTEADHDAVVKEIQCKLCYCSFAWHALIALAKCMQTLVHTLDTHSIKH